MRYGYYTNNWTENLYVNTLKMCDKKIENGNQKQKKKTKKDQKQKQEPITKQTRTNINFPIQQ